MLTSLSYLLAVAKHGSITKASEALFISQPALSASLIRLEKKLGVKLLNRSSDGAVLTEAGECVAGHAADICLSYDQMLNDLAALDVHSNSILRVGSGMRHAAHIIDSFLYKHPSETVMLTQYNSHYDMKRALLSHEIGLCISAPPIEGACITSKTLCVEQLCVAFGAGHPLASKEEVCLSELMGTKLLALPKGFSLRIVTDKIFEEAGLRPIYTIQAENNALIDLLNDAHTTGYAVIYPVSRCMELHEASPNIEFRPLIGNITRTISASWLDDTTITPQFELMLKHVEEYYSAEKYSVSAHESRDRQTI